MPMMTPNTFRFMCIDGQFNYAKIITQDSRRNIVISDFSILKHNSQELNIHNAKAFGCVVIIRIKEWK